MTNIYNGMFEYFLTDWARVLMTIPQVTSVFYVGTSVWYGAEGSTRLTPNFVVRTTDPYWDRFKDDGVPYGRAAHMLPVQADEAAMARFCTKWRDHNWGPSLSDSSMLSGNSLWVTQFSQGAKVRIVEAPATLDWAGPEYLCKVEGGISYEFIFQEALRYFNPTEERLMPARHYFSSDHPPVETPARSDAP